MAIKVNGTTVIDDSRNFTNINSGFKTVNGTSVVGSGDISAGASTSAGAVGTYAILANNQYSSKSWGNTISGSDLFYTSGNSHTFDYQYDSTYQGGTVSGTWRLMAGYVFSKSGSTGAHNSFWVRIS